MDLGGVGILPTAWSDRFLSSGSDVTLSLVRRRRRRLLWLSAWVPNGGRTVDQEVQWLLAEKLLHIRTGLVNPREDVIRRRSVALATFDSTLEALRYVNAISDEESIEWRSKMWRALGLDPPHVGEPGTTQLVYLGDGEPPRSERINLVPQYPQAKGPAETIEAFGGSLRVEEIEYDDGVTLVRGRSRRCPTWMQRFPT